MGIPAIPAISCRIAKLTILQREKPACFELFGWTIPKVRDGLDGQVEPEGRERAAAGNSLSREGAKGV